LPVGRLMPDEPELPSTRSIIEKDARAPDSRAAPASNPGEDEDFRRIIARLRAVLQVRQS
jgi:hypothetical protein